MVTNDEKMAREVAAMRDHGRLPGEKYTHSFEAYNERMDALQASVLNVKLDHIGRWTEKRIENAGLYAQKLKGVGGILLPHPAPGRRHVYHLYVIRLEGRGPGPRDELQRALKARGIGAGVHYPIPLHLLEAYGYMGLERGSFPVTEAVCGEILSLPMYPELAEEQIGFVAGSIMELL